MVIVIQSSILMTLGMNLSLCIMFVHYVGGSCEYFRGCSAYSKDTIILAGGYHEVIGGCSVQSEFRHKFLGGGHTSDWWRPSTLRLKRGPKNLSESLKIRP